MVPGTQYLYLLLQYYYVGNPYLWIQVRGTGTVPGYPVWTMDTWRANRKSTGIPGCGFRPWKVLGRVTVTLSFHRGGGNQDKLGCWDDE